MSPVPPVLLLATRNAGWERLVTSTYSRRSRTRSLSAASAWEAPAYLGCPAIEPRQAQPQTVSHLQAEGSSLRRQRAKTGATGATRLQLDFNCAGSSSQAEGRGFEALLPLQISPSE